MSFIGGMISYDGITCELDESASGMELVLPPPDAKDPRPGLLIQLRFIMPEAVPERGDFIGQDAMLLLRPAFSLDIDHWQDLNGFTYEPPPIDRRHFFDRILLYPEPVVGQPPDPEMLNSTDKFHYSLRAVSPWNYYLEMDALLLPVRLASQQLFGWGPGKPSDDTLQELSEELRVLEILPLWRVHVEVPPGLADAESWAREQAALRLGLDEFRIQPGGRYRELKFPDSGHIPDPPPVCFLTPWADGEGE